MTLTRTTPTSRRTAAWVTVVGLGVVCVAAWIAWSWREELPKPVATHWGRTAPDGFSTLSAAVTTLLVPGIVLVLAFGGVILFLGQSAVTRRIGAAVTVGISLFLSLVMLGTLNVQRGLGDAHDAGDVGAIIAVALVGALAAAVVAGLLVPGDPPQPTAEAVAADAPRVGLYAGELATWTGRTDSGPLAGLGLTVVALILGLVVVTRIWVLLILVVVLAAVLVAMGTFRVRVDRTGLTVRSWLGWPRIRVPLDELVRADVTEVSPLRDFGGWGLRVGRQGRVGVVLRRGEALAVERTGGRSVVVTVDDARSAAGVLNALADRLR